MISGIEIISSNTQALINLPLTFIPQLVVAIAILLIGWIVGWIAERALIAIFRALPFLDEALRNVGLEEVTKRAGMRINLGKFFGTISKVFVIFIFLVASLDILGLESVNQFLIGRVLDYIPNVASAALVMVIGLIIANFVSNLIAGASRAAKVDGGIAAKITKWSIVVLSVLVAVGELGIANEIIQSMIVGVIAATSLALGLAFGLGGQQAASEFIDRVRRDIEG